MNELKAGIIGVGGYGRFVLGELGRNDAFVVQAIGDRDRELADDLAQRYEATAYDDYRSLIVEENLDVLFLSLPTFLCNECIRLAAKAGIHVFKEAPVARTLPDALQWSELMERARCRLHIGAPKRFAPGYLQARQIIKEGQIGPVYLVRAEQFLNYQGSLEWRGDPGLSGGGVLLEQAYHLIDIMTWIMQAPEKVYSLNANCCNKRVAPPYRTEDTAVLIMNFGDGAIGNLTAGWMTGPPSERIIVHGVEGTIEAAPDQITHYDVAGAVRRREEFDVSEEWLIAQQIRQFADSLLDEEVKPISSARDHYSNIAVVEAAYLSARTQLPEPLKVYGSLVEL